MTVVKNLTKAGHDFFTGETFRKISNMPSNGVKNTLLKVLAVAAATGLIFGLFSGPIVGVTLAVIAGITSFAYFTSTYDVTQWSRDVIYDNIS